MEGFELFEFGLHPVAPRCPYIESCFAPEWTPKIILHDETGVYSRWFACGFKGIAPGAAPFCRCQPAADGRLG